jgi:uncharacterized tellurite resistance protein B-like protein
MLARLREIFSSKSDDTPELDEEQLPIAVCVLLLEVARADEEFSADERAHVVETLRARYALSDEDAHELIEIATASREESYDLWHFTHRINETCSIPEKVAVIEEVWRVIYADGILDAHEDYLVHKLAKLLNLTHPQLIDAKLKVLGRPRG